MCSFDKCDREHWLWWADTEYLKGFLLVVSRNFLTPSTDYTTFGRSDYTICCLVIMSLAVLSSLNYMTTITSLHMLFHRQMSPRANFKLDIWNNIDFDLFWNTRAPWIISSSSYVLLLSRVFQIMLPRVLHSDGCSFHWLSLDTWCARSRVWDGNTLASLSGGVCEEFRQFSIHFTWVLLNFCFLCTYCKSCSFIANSWCNCLEFISVFCVCFIVFRLIFWFCFNTLLFSCFLSSALD